MKKNLTKWLSLPITCSLIALPFITSYGSISSEISLNATASNTNNDGNGNRYIHNFIPRLYFADDTEFPIYVMPDVNKSLAPNFKEIAIKNGYPFANDVLFDEYGWPTLDSLNKVTYQQLFLNDDVAEYFDNGSDFKHDTINLLDIYKKVNNVHNCIINLTPNDKHSYYQGDIYADDTVKCLNNPLFYSLVKDNHSVFNNITQINLSNNDLWYIPYFGYRNGVDLTTKHPSPWVNKNEAGGGLSSLSLLDLTNNNITTLPISNASTKNDITSWLSSPNSIHVDGNCMLAHPTKTSESMIWYYLSYDTKYSIPSAMLYNFGEYKGKSIPYQSSAFIKDTKYIANYLYNFLETYLGIDKNTLSILDLSAHHPRLAQLVPQFAGYNPELYTIADCLSQLAINYVNDNYLASNFVYTANIYNILFVSLIEEYQFMYSYNQYTTSSGSLSFTVGVAGQQSCEYDETTGKYTLDADINGLQQDFISFWVSGFKSAIWMIVLLSIIFSLLILVVGFIIFYFSFLKKWLTNKHKKQDKVKIRQLEQKGDK